MIMTMMSIMCHSRDHDHEDDDDDDDDDDEDGADDDDDGFYEDDDTPLDILPFLLTPGRVRNILPRIATYVGEMPMLSPTLPRKRALKDAWLEAWRDTWR